MLEQRITDLNAAYTAGTRDAGRDIKGDYPHMADLISQLSGARERLSGVANTRARREYAMRLPPEVLEFAVYPNTEDPVVHQLLPRLSWDTIIRAYHDTEGFLRSFTGADDEGKQAMLGRLQFRLLFRNQQNNDLNAWLYQNHRAACEKAGVEFELVK